MALTKFSLMVSAADFRAYQAAARTLAKIMGRRRAPTACALMEFNLSQRDAGGIADDYLDSIGWLNGPDRGALTKAAGIASRAGADCCGRQVDYPFRQNSDGQAGGASHGHGCRQKRA